MSDLVHQFYAIAFEENISLKELSRLFPTAQLTAHELCVRLGDGGVYVYPFGAVVTFDLSTEQREIELQRLITAVPKLTTHVVREEFAVREDATATTGVSDGVLVLDRLTPERAGVVALTIAQSAAMEYYETIVEQLVARTVPMVERL